MKKLLLVLLCLPMFGFGQNVNIPDANFKAYLVGHSLINTNGDSEIQLGEANSFSGLIQCMSMNIADLTGIEAFTNLNHLHVADNPLTSLDLSQNTALTGLAVNDNQLTNLDVSQNTALTTFICSGNQLTSLDVSQNTALIDLDCKDNQLTSLDVSQNTALELLLLSNNQLTTIDVSTNTALTFFSCRDNQLTSLDVSQNIALTFFFCFNNQLTNLDVRNGNNISFQNFETYNNPNLYCINVDDASWADTNWTVANGSIDSTMSFSTNCLMAFGCTDSVACNYDSTATIDDSSCVYHENVFLSDTACDSYTASGITYNLSGWYTWTLTNSVNCDSNIFLALTINNSTSSFDTLSVPASILWNGMLLDSSGDYSIVYTNMFGCDSIVNLNLTVTTTGVSDIANNKSNLVKITDMLGQRTPYRKNTPLIYIYDDGTVEKKITIE